MGTRQPGRSAMLFGVTAMVVATAWFAGSFLVAMLEPPESPEVEGPALTKDSEKSARDSEPDVVNDRVVAPPAEGAGPVHDGTGLLRIALLDAETDAPLVDHPYHVFKEQGGVAFLARGVTDAKGEGEALHLPAGLYLVETERRPPHAPTVGAVEVVDGNSSRLDVRVGHGGVVTGRVVDDTGAGQANFPVGISNAARGRRDLQEDPRERTEVARTDSEGNYRIEALKSTPRGLWWIEGELRVERWDPVEITALAEWIRPSVQVQVADRDLAEAPDLVLMAYRHWQGTVVDEGGQPVVGALVSMRPERREFSAEEDRDAASPWSLPPDDPNFEWHPPEECLTDESGHFVVSLAREDASWIQALGPDGEAKGSLMFFALPRLRPGEFSEELIIRLKSSTELTLDFEVDGVPEDIRTALEDCPGTEAFGRSDRDWNAISSTARTPKGGWAWASLEVNAETGTSAGWSAKTAPSRIKALEVRVPGYQRADVAFPVPVSPGDRVRVPLVPWLRTDVELRDVDGALVESESCQVYLRLTYVEPSDEDPLAHASLGSGTTVDLDAKGAKARLIATVRGQHWITAHPPHAAGVHRSFGPFGTGTGPHVLELDAEFIAACLEEPAAIPDPPPFGAPTEAPAEVTEPENTPKTEVRFTAQDAVTGESLLEFNASVACITGPSAGRSFFARARNSTIRREVPAGAIRVTVRAEGYLPSDPREFEALEGELVDLGTFRLEPARRFRGRVVDAQGEPVPEHTGLYLFEPDGTRRTGLPLGPGGRFEFIGELPDEFVLHVAGDRIRPGEAGAGAQQLRGQAWDSEEVHEVRLAPWRPLELWIHGHAPEHREVRVDVGIHWIDLDPLPDPPMGPWHGQLIDGAIRSRSTWSAETHGLVDWRGDGIRLLEFASAPTRVRIEVESPLLDYEALEVDVVAGEGTQKIEIWPR